MRILAVDDGSFGSGASSKRGGKALFLGVIVSDFRIERVLLSAIEVDGLDATEKLVEMIKISGEAIDLVLLPSISCAGFNLVSPDEVYGILKIPLVVVNPKEPRDVRVEAALQKHFSDWEKRLKIIRAVGHPKKLSLSSGETVFFHVFGLNDSAAEKIIRESIVFGKTPEPLRIAHLIARGLSQ